MNEQNFMRGGGELGSRVELDFGSHSRPQVSVSSSLSSAKDALSHFRPTDHPLHHHPGHRWPKRHTEGSQPHSEGLGLCGQEHPKS